MRYAATLAFTVLFVAGTGAAALDSGGLTVESQTVDSRSADWQPEPAPEQWNRTFGGDGDDMLADVAKTEDGGYVVVGWVENADSRDGWVVKVGPDGERQWERTFEGPGTDKLYAVESTQGGYVLAGRTDRNGSPQGWVLTLAPDGTTREERTLGAGAFYAMTRDGNHVVLAGWTRVGGNVGGWAARLGTDGVAWERRYPAPDGYSTGRLKAVVPGPNGFFFGGEVESGNADAWAMRVGTNGEPRWDRTHGSPARESVWAAAGGDGGLVLAGESWRDDNRNGWVLRYESDGSRSWEKRYGGPDDDWLDSAMHTDDGYVFTGGTLTGGIGGADGLVVGTDANGEEQWRTVVGSESWDKPWPAVRAHGGGYLLAGQTAGFGASGKDGWVLHLGANGGSDATTRKTTASPTSTDGTTTSETTTVATADEQAGVGRTALLGVAGVCLLTVLVWRALSRR